MITFLIFENLGGDLRLHDRNSRSVKDWASMQPDNQKRHTALDFLESLHLKALNDDESQSEISVSRGYFGRFVIRNLLNPPLSKKSEKRGTDFEKVNIT